MKTENLTFIEAVQALKDMRCMGIRHRAWIDPDVHLVINSEMNWFAWSNPSCRFMGFAMAHICDAGWSLVNPVMPTEERELKQFALITKDGRIIEICDHEEDAVHMCMCDQYVVRLSGKYTVPVPQKEKKRVEVEGVEWQCLSHGLKPYSMIDGEGDKIEKFVGKKGTLTFEWED